MGVKLASLPIADHNFSQSSQIQNSYYKKIIASQQMSSRQFCSKLASISKRAAYLKYEWAAELSKLSKEKRFYSEYRSALMQNCLREGRKERLFCPEHFKTAFLKALSPKIQQSLKNNTMQGLSTIIEQCKAFLMVVSWLYELVSLQKSIWTEDQDEEESNRSGEQTAIQSQNKEIYEKLLDLAEKYYQKLFKFDKVESVVVIADAQILDCIARLKKTRLFHERQLIIMELIKILQTDNDKENGIRNFKGVCQHMGKANVAAYLLLIREVGISQEFIVKKYLDLCMETCVDLNQEGVDSL